MIQSTDTRPSTVAHVRLHGRLDEPLGRGSWLVKWVLLIPHYVVLLVLWIGVVLSTLAAMVAILATGRHPRRLFDFTCGVLRWTWRVSFYGYSALATDRYPPFTLRPVPDYPATLEIDRPEQLSRRIVLLKPWLLALPHLLVVGLLMGGFGLHPWGPGLVGVLVIVAGVHLLLGRRYPPELFDLVMGLNRWVARVAAYTLLLCDEYPPFRLDQGPDDEGVHAVGSQQTRHPLEGGGGAAGDRSMAGRLPAVR